MTEHPMQEIVTDAYGQRRFRENAIVHHLLALAGQHGCELNKLERMSFSSEDKRQFAQLIGYTLDGYRELPYVDSISYQVACRANEGSVAPAYERLVAVEDALRSARAGMREGLAALYDRHPDDFCDSMGRLEGQ